MNQKVTFTAFLQDEYSRKFDKLAERTDADVKQIAKDFDKLNTSGRKAARTIDDLDRRIKVLSQVKKFTLDTSAIKFANQEIKALQKEKEKLEGSSSGSKGFMGMGFGNLSLIGAGVVGVRGLAAAGKALTIDSAKAYMNYEAIVQSFQVLTKNDGVGKALAERLNKYQQDTILGPEVFKSAETLLSFGVSVNKVEKDIMMLGNVSRGNADKMQSLTLAFAQTQSAGRLMGQDLLQYVNAGFNPLSVMSERWKEFGFTSRKTMGQLRKDMENGLITAAQVEKAFELATGKGGLFDNMLNRVGETSFGKAKQLEGQWESLKIAIGERFKPQLESTLSLLSSTVATVKQWVEVPVAEKINAEANRIRQLHFELTSANTSEERRKELLLELEKINPRITDGIDQQKLSYEKLAENIAKVTDGMQKQITLSIMTKESAGMLSRYEELKMQRSEKLGQIMSAVYDVSPEIASNTKLTDSQKMQAAADLVNKQREEYYKANPDKRGRVDPLTGKAKFLAGDLKTLSNIDQAMNALQPSIDAFDKKAKALGQVIEKTTPGTGADNKGGKNGGGKSLGETTTGTGTGSTVPSISGGSKITHLNIQIGALISGGMTVQSTTVKEGAAQVKDIVLEHLLTAVNDVNMLAN